MTRAEDPQRSEHRLVVVFDICSSTTILEDLKRTDNLSRWRNLLIHLKSFLLRHGEPLTMELYKFIGDGWILLFPFSVERKGLCDFLQKLSLWFSENFDRQVAPVLHDIPSDIGLTFGIDSGELVRLEMDHQIEYLGRAINVASRLQGETKKLTGGPTYKAIFSKNSLPKPNLVPVKATVVELRNVTPPKFSCFVYETLHSPSKKSTDGGFGEISFKSWPSDKLPDQWILKEGVLPTFSVGKNGGLNISSPGVYALDHSVAKTTTHAKRARVKISYRDANATLYFRILMSSSAGTRIGWLALKSGDSPPRKESDDEWVIYFPDLLSEGGRTIDINFAEATRRTFGRTGDWTYHTFLGIRLRGSLQISRIQFPK